MDTVQHVIDKYRTSIKAYEQVSWERAVVLAREEWEAEQRAAGEAEGAAAIEDVQADIDPMGR